MKRLPIGRHEFVAMREEDFLSRHRGFGKSMTISTLEAIFQGKNKGIISMEKPENETNTHAA